MVRLKDNHHPARNAVMKPLKLVALIMTTLILLGWFFQDGSAQNQDDIDLVSVSVNLLPEFTRPNVLVVFEITLEERLPLPQELTFEIPADVQVLKVYNFTPEEQPLELVYQSSRDENWKNLSITASYPQIRIEYQDPNLIRQDDQRWYDFQWLSFYPVGELSVNVRQPEGASDFQSQPPLLRRASIPEDDVDYTRIFGAIPANELFTLSFSYTKESDDAAQPELPVEPASPIDGNAPGRTPAPASVILWLLVASLAVVIVVGTFYWRYRTNIHNQQERFVQGVGILNPEKQAFFCHECGMRSKAGDRYCSNYGTELRKVTQFE
jgi:hypothetical protein